MGNTPRSSILDVGQSTLIMWDGQKIRSSAQVFGPLESAVESEQLAPFGVAQVFANYKAEYEAVFGRSRLDGFTTLSCFDRQPKPVASNSTLTVLAPGKCAERPGTEPSTTVWPRGSNRGDARLGERRQSHRRLRAIPLVRAGQVRSLDSGRHDRVRPRRAAWSRALRGKGRCVDCHSGPFLSDENFTTWGSSPRQSPRCSWMRTIREPVRGSTVGMDQC